MALTMYAQRSSVAALVLSAWMVTICTAPATAADKGDVYTAEEQSHWSLQPRSQSSVPAFDEPQDAGWLSNPIDAFILARLKQAELRPSPPAERRTLVRRLNFNLLGLPPTPEEIQ